MVKWFDRTPRDVTRQLLRQHRAPVLGDRVLLSDVRPALVPFVGQALALELALVAKAGGVIEQAPSLDARIALAEVVRIHASRAGAFARILDGEDVEADAALRPFTESTRDFTRAIDGADWYEQLLAIHVVSGLLEDFFVAIVPGLPEEDQDAMLRALRGESAHPHMVRLLLEAIEGTPRLSDRMAVWGRRLVGDVLLQMYLAVNGPDATGRAVPSQARLEPAFNDIVASHTRRMDELGLTA
ncbi:tRNA-(MS[2]IO[6]A)-hydroxylase (MiaE)-like [Agrococcus baldri]|uniref:tRNA-(MS[2]IO[6]A)-hydroxylase (MiaE)-like n=1 Tax=Agrococcus baldri TaxID=153730 RepID=A0AA94L010_9MICO|nr:ferritin-like fold-containing protein [Agrococcus baldri]SFS15466.1 tRNA-(MS[2]IO[6]A)-hydroxylase (MiaE)-like [Agrococcus baldri]